MSIKRIESYFEEVLQLYGCAGQTPGCLLGKMSLEVATEKKLIREILSGAYERWQRAIESVLREAVRQGDLAAKTRIKDMSAFLVNSWEGAVLRSLADQSQEPLKFYTLHPCEHGRGGKDGSAL